VLKVDRRRAGIFIDFCAREFCYDLAVTELNRQWIFRLYAMYITTHNKIKVDTIYKKKDSWRHFLFFTNCVTVGLKRCFYNKLVGFDEGFARTGDALDAVD